MKERDVTAWTDEAKIVLSAAALDRVEWTDILLQAERKR